MKTRVWPGMISQALCLMVLAANGQQVAFTNLHNFGDMKINRRDFDGVDYYSGFAISGGALYGGMSTGENGSGTIFSIHTDGSGYSNFHSFSALAFNPALQDSVNSDGNAPMGDLVLAGTNLYGVTRFAGSNGSGVVFQIGTNGLGYSVLHTFSGEPRQYSYDEEIITTNSDGTYPDGGLIFSSNVLYGTTSAGGSGSSGTIFSLDLSTLILSNLHVFSMIKEDLNREIPTNSDGGFAVGALALINGSLYGTTQAGGTGGEGTIFRIAPNGSDFTNLHNFIVADGVTPQAALVSDGSVLYGTTAYGAPLGHGGIFRMGLDGGGFTNLYEFTGGDDGGNPSGGVILSNDILYGTAENGGQAGSGTVYQLALNGNEFTSLYSFSDWAANSSGLDTNGDGVIPNGGLTLSGGTLYGITYTGGLGGFGTVFAVSLPVAPVLLNIQWAATNLVLSWTNPTYLLEAASTADGPYGYISGATSPYTNASAGTAQFFKLRLP